jgi:hypothetical protein
MMFPSIKNGKVISCEEFIQLDPNDIEIYVVGP